MTDAIDEESHMTHLVMLSHDEALVLCDFFGRFQQSNEFVLRHNAEFVAFSSISAQLDKALVEPFHANYNELVAAARRRVAGDYEGLAPGVVSNDAEA